jgi:hypothetical protein
MVALCWPLTLVKGFRIGLWIHPANLPDGENLNDPVYFVMYTAFTPVIPLDDSGFSASDAGLARR